MVRYFPFLLVMLTTLTWIGCSNQAGAGGPMSFPPMPVEVVRARVQSVADRFEGVGTIEATDAITVVSEIDASVQALPFTEGGWIKRGELIAQLDGAALAAEVARNEALRDQAKNNYDRLKAAGEAVTAHDLDNAEANFKIAEANLALARVQYAKTRIVAPFDGNIGARKVSIGTFLRTGDAITELANIDEIRVTFSVPERFLATLERGAEVAVSTTAFPDHLVAGRIMAIEPVVDPGTRSARVVARVPNAGRKFRPGMSANVSAILSQRPAAITIPNEAIFAAGNQSFVFVVNPDSTVARAALTLGTRFPDVVEVLSGLDSNALVVRAGHQKIFDGAKVMPVSSNPAGATQH